MAYRVCLDGKTCCGMPRLVREEDAGRRIRRFYAADSAIERVVLELHELADRQTGVGEYSLLIENHSDQPVRLTQADIGAVVEKQPVRVYYYTSDWGNEFQPFQAELEDAFFLKDSFFMEVQSGRSTKGYAPWMGLETAEGFVSLNIGWSGNWQASVASVDGHPEWLLAGMGISSRDFYLDIPPEGRFESPKVYCSASSDGREAASFGIRQYFSDYVSIIDKDNWESLPVCYNSWWPYRDILISEDRCVENAAEAQKLGIPNFLLDAGWFGSGQGWVETRGDWDIENREKFPHGIAWLGEAINRQGIKFGIWCEIEAVGPEAELNHTHPELIATRDGQPLGYVCMGNPQTVDWALKVVDKLVGEYGAHWIKFDFNLDPGVGCNRTDHGHGAGDGLYAHYMGYYRFLETIREKYPDLVLESCSSGGLRMDYGILSRMHFAFLSDPDYVDHHFQTFWGATTFIHPSGCYHFTQSQMLEEDNGPGEPHNPISEDMSRTKFDYYIRSGLLCSVGFSYDLTGWPEWCKERLKEHVEFFKRISGPYILRGSMYRLTGQAIHRGKGERFQAYQFTAQDGSACVMTYLLRGAKGERRVPLMGLSPDRTYQVSAVDRGETYQASGAQLMEEGILLHGDEESSEIYFVN